MPQHDASLGLLLVNLGTPSAPATKDVRRYLRQFLSDPRVIDIHPFARWLLLNLFILPFRPARSAAAYRQIWQPEGSPLLVYSQRLQQRLQENFPELAIELAMRYGSPSIALGLQNLAKKGCSRIVVLPLYPQYAASSTGSTLEEVFRLAAKLWNTPFISVIPPFYDHPGFIEAFTHQGQAVIERVQPDHVIFSFHGLPERQIHKSDPSGAYCLQQKDCCSVITSSNQYCYRAQCFATARALAQKLQIATDRYTVSFQSRLGRTPWIQPYTDVILPKLVREGVRKVVVFCPAFVADCLETLEEVAIRGAEQFRSAGGQILELVPSLNAEPIWVAGLTQLIQENLPSGLSQ